MKQEPNNEDEDEKMEMSSLAERWVSLVFAHIEYKRKFQDIGNDVRKKITIKNEYEN